MHDTSRGGGGGLVLNFLKNILHEEGSRISFDRCGSK